MDYNWMEMAKRSLIRRNINMVEHIIPQKLTNVSCVRVLAPADRVCSIYGEVSFQVGGSSTALFRRGPHQPDVIDLTGRENYLTFSDSHGPARALPPVSPTNPLRVKMDLTEITASGEHVKIAKIDECNCICEDGMELGRCFDLDGLGGFVFQVCYSVVHGALVKVGAAIMKREEGDDSMAIQVIAYHFSLDDSKDPEGMLPQTRAVLASVKSTTVEPWKAIDFERKFVVAPVREGQFLSIALCVAMNGEQVEYYDVDFPLMFLWNEDTKSLLASKERVHIRTLFLLPSGTKLGVSLTFLPDLLVEDAQTRVKHDIQSAPTSLERECEHDDDGGGLN